MFYDVKKEKIGPVTTNVAEFLLPRLGPLYPQIYITVRYKIHPVTGLFIYKKEEDIECFFSPNGWDSPGDFSAPNQNLEKSMSHDQKLLHYKTRITVRLGDAKASLGIKDSGVEFSAPHQTVSIRIEGHIDTRGHGRATCWKV